MNENNSGRLLLFTKFVGDECFNRVHGFGFVGTVGADLDDGPDTGRQHHHRHDAFTIHFLAVFSERDLALKARGGRDKFSGGPGMQPELIYDLDVFFKHDVFF